MNIDTFKEYIRGYTNLGYCFVWVLIKFKNFMRVDHLYSKNKFIFWFDHTSVYFSFLFDCK
jgi:hypothetical protein